MLLLVPGEFPFYRYIIIRKTYPQRERSLSLAKWTQIIFLPLLLSYCMWSASWVYFRACVCYLPVFVYCLACAPLATCTENKRNVQTTNHVIKDPSHRKWTNKQQERCTRAIKSNENSKMKLVHSTHSEYRAVQTEPTQQWPRTLGHHINKAVYVVFFRSFSISLCLTLLLFRYMRCQNGLSLCTRPLLFRKRATWPCDDKYDRNRPGIELRQTEPALAPSIRQTNSQTKRRIYIKAFSWDRTLKKMYPI